MMLDSILILPKNNLKSSIADEGKPLIDNGLLYTRTKELVKLLKDVGIIYFDSTTNMYNYAPFLEGDRRKNRIPQMVSKMLGYVAEGIVVRECNTDLSQNAKWANVARLLRENHNSEDENPLQLSLFVNWIKKYIWYLSLPNPNHYRAIGTGFATTQIQDPSYYSKQSYRDICWIKNAASAVELLNPNKIIAGKLRNAGIQIKVSSGLRGYYVTKYFKTTPYFNIYPVVYFDLGNDFDIVRNKLLSPTLYPVEPNTLFSSDVCFLDGRSKEDIVDIMLRRGRDIDPSLHEELLYYQSVLNKLVTGGISLFDLTDEKMIFGLVLEYLGRNMVKDSSILTISYSL